MDLIDAFNSDFNNTITRTLTKQILSGINALNIFFANNKEFFSYPENSALKSYLLNYSVESSLRNAAFTPTAVYKAIPIKVNSFGRSVLHIMTNNFQVTAAKTDKWNSLPVKSKYKLKHSQANANGDRQMCFDFDKNEISSENNLFYALLTYGYNIITSECSHIDLLVPNSSFNSIIERKDLLPDTKSSLFSINTESEVEETVVALNDEFKKIVTLKSMKTGGNHE